MKYSFTTLLYTALLTTLLCTGVRAQGSLEMDGQWHDLEATGYHREFIMPYVREDRAQIELELRGDDGNLGVTSLGCRGKGGQGATLRLALPIGDDFYDTPPGARVRFIVGVRGDRASFFGGGPGSAVFRARACIFHGPKLAPT